MIILTLFGTTTGLELLNIPLVNNVPPLKLEDAWIGVTPSQLTLHPDKDVFLVFRRSVGGHLVTWIGLYRPVREMGYDRAGTFYGAGVWVIDGAVDAKILIVLLREMINQIQVNAIQGDRFVKRIADVRGQFTPPSQVSALAGSHSKINSGIKPEGESGFIVEGASPIDVIEWAQRATSANYFAKIVVGAADQAPNAGQSSGFKIFPSLSMAIDASYQRLTSDYRNRFQELSQSIKSLENKNTEINGELQITLRKLQQTESARELSDRQLRESQQKYNELHRENTKLIFQSGFSDNSKFRDTINFQYPDTSSAAKTVLPDLLPKPSINSSPEPRQYRTVVKDKPIDYIFWLLVAMLLVMIGTIVGMGVKKNEKCKFYNFFCESEMPTQHIPNSFSRPEYPTNYPNPSPDSANSSLTIQVQREQSENNLSVNKKK